MYLQGLIKRFSAQYGSAKKHTAMLVCLCKALLRKEGAIHLQKSKRLSSISVRKELHEYFMQTLGKEYLYSTEK